MQFNYTVLSLYRIYGLICSLAVVLTLLPRVIMALLGPLLSCFQAVFPWRPREFIT